MFPHVFPMGFDCYTPMGCSKKLRVESIFRSDELLASLAKDDERALPSSIRRPGYKVMSRVAEYIKSLYPNRGVGVSLVGKEFNYLLKLLGIENCKRDLLPRVQMYDVASFVNETLTSLKHNPIIVAFAAEWSMMSLQEQKKCIPPAVEGLYTSDDSKETKEMREQDIREAVAVGALLDTFAYSVYHEPQLNLLRPGFKKKDVTEDMMRRTLIGTVYLQASNKRKSKKNWKKYWNLFERIKMKLMDKIMQEDVYMKLNDNSVFDNKSGDGRYLQANIMDAMYADVMRKCDDNAEAGFELMCQTVDKTPNPETGDGISTELKVDGKETGVVLHKIACQKAYNNLYISWNAAFVSSYPDSILYAKLFNPFMASSNKRNQEQFFYSRALTLWLNLQYLALKRVQVKTVSVSALSWHNQELTLLWGKLNLLAAKQYQKRTEAAHDRSRKGYSYDAWRKAKFSLWATLRQSFRTARFIGGTHTIPHEPTPEVQNLYKRYIYNDEEDEEGKDKPKTKWSQVTAYIKSWFVT
jgi:hypothetical protein